MSKIIKKTMKNGNVYLYFASGKTKVIKADGTIRWYSFNIFNKFNKSKPKKTNKH